LLLGAAGASLPALGNRHKLAEAEADLADGRDLLRDHQYAPAVRRLTRGLELARGRWGGGDLTRALEGHLLRARRLLAAAELHRVADHLRFLVAPETLAVRQLQTLESHCRRIWEARGRLLTGVGGGGDRDLDRRLRTDLLDLACLWADLRVRLPGLPRDQARQRALQVLDEAEALLGPSLALAHQRRLFGTAPDQLAAGGQQPGEETPRTAWDHYLLGRSWLRAGRPDLAEPLLEQAAALEPEGFWPNFFWGVCAYRLKRYPDADKALSVCIALAPRVPQGYFNRAQVHTAAGRWQKALEDYGRALKIDPSFAAAVLNRGLLHARLEHYPEAAADLRRALRDGADPAAVHYNLAVLHHAQNDRPAALAALEDALRYDPANAKARQLLDLLRKNQGGRRPRFIPGKDH
jgi:eukaryotic-like serine/threonine-protein kinase